MDRFACVCSKCRTQACLLGPLLMLPLMIEWIDCSAWTGLRPVTCLAPLPRLDGNYRASFCLRGAGEQNAPPWLSFRVRLAGAPVLPVVRSPSQARGMIQASFGCDEVQHERRLAQRREITSGGHLWLHLHHCQTLGGKKIALQGGGGDTEAHFPNPPPLPPWPP